MENTYRALHYTAIDQNKNKNKNKKPQRVRRINVLFPVAYILLLTIMIKFH